MRLISQYLMSSRCGEVGETRSRDLIPQLINLPQTVKNQNEQLLEKFDSIVTLRPRSLNMLTPEHCNPVRESGRENVNTENALLSTKLQELKSRSSSCQNFAVNCLRALFRSKELEG